MRKSLMRMTLRQLRVFRAVCDNHSYSRAAGFDVERNAVQCHDAAEALKRTSEDIFGRLESLDMQLSTLQGSLQGQLKLAIESSAKYFVPHLFALFRDRHPEVSLQLVVVNHAQAVHRSSCRTSPPGRC